MSSQVNTKPLRPLPVISLIQLQTNTNQRTKFISSHFSSRQSGGGCGLLSVMHNQILHISRKEEYLGFICVVF